MRRSFLIVAVGLLAAVLLGASAFAADDAAKKVYYSLYDNSDMFISLVRNAIEAEAKEQGLPTVPADAQKDQNRQLSQIEQFVAQGAQVLIINPVDATSAPAIIDAAKGENSSSSTSAPRTSTSTAKTPSTWVPTNPSWSHSGGDDRCLLQGEGRGQEGRSQVRTLHG
jgi:hypothetical protein